MIPRKAKIIAVTSGKGGVGKTNTSVNLAVALSSLPRRVCLFDADTNQANANILLGLKPKLTLEHVLNGQHPIEDILIKAPGGVSIIPAASGIADGEDLDGTQRQRLTEALTALEETFDYLIIDTAAGSGHDVIFFLKAAAFIILVITPEPTSLTNSFSLLRVMRRAGVSAPTHVVVNQVANIQEFRTVFNRFHAAVTKYLQQRVAALGHILTDDNVGAAVRIQRPVIFLRYDAPASLCFYELAKRLDHAVTDPLPANTQRSLSEAVASSAKPVEPTTANDDPPATALTRLDPQRVSELLSYAVRAVQKTENLAQSDIATGIDALVSAFVERFAALPFELNRTLYQHLETSGYPADSIRSIVLTLETLYERREKRALRDTESLIAIIMAESHGDENRMTELARHVAERFTRQFGHAAPLLPAQALAAIAEGQFDRATLQRLRNAADAALKNSNARQEAPPRPQPREAG
ncbi:MinD/ParA family protein [Acidihalobacter ferrooxydans]|uniref:AAA domain-containing protein n=1 Tax=Acidihalobacter ferrooxydans TaxID=1765967 RepID=A0A1P8UED9_9GAMM|nr:MinD/ParA family protein [Acidihalobacter ferrooxydans]APZ42213.1 hypothetical protein BW247_03150 [Acidihalobacter ferrooxydans]